MCNLSMGILNKGEMKRAKETAYELRDMGLSDEKIARAVKVSMIYCRSGLQNANHCL